MSIKDLSQKEKDRIIDLIRNDETLPKEDIYKLFEDEEDVFYSGMAAMRNAPILRCPFIPLNISTSPERKSRGSGQLFDERGRQQQGWTNKLLWGDNKLILSSLVNGPLCKEIEAKGGLKLVHIDLLLPWVPIFHLILRLMPIVRPRNNQLLRKLPTVILGDGAFLLTFQWIMERATMNFNRKPIPLVPAMRFAKM